MAEKKIAGMVIKVDRPLATEALKMKARLMKAAGGNIQHLLEVGLKSGAALVSVKEAEKPDSKATEEQKAAAKAALAAYGAELLGAVSEIFETLSPQEYVDLVGDILAMGQMQRPSSAYEPLDLDGDFSMNLGAVYPVCFFILKEVFGDFFSGALASGSRAMKATA